jgi:hypothetical protein
MFKFLNKNVPGIQVFHRMHSEGATLSKSSRNQLKVKGDVPKAKGDPRISGSSRLLEGFAQIRFQ